MYTFFSPSNHCSRRRQSNYLISCVLTGYQRVICYMQKVYPRVVCNIAVRLCDLMRNVYVDTGEIYTVKVEILNLNPLTFILS